MSCMSYHIPQWVMSRILSCHTHESIMHMNYTCHAYECVISQISMRHVTRINHFRHTHVWIMSCIPVSHATQINRSCHAYEYVMSHARIRHVTRMNTSCHAYQANHATNESVISLIYTHYTHELVMPSLSTRPLTLTNLWSHVYTQVTWHTWMECVMSRICLSHVTRTNESWFIHKWVMHA